MKIAHPKTKIGTTLLAKMCFDFMADILTIELGFRQLLLSLENARGKARNTVFRCHLAREGQGADAPRQSPDRRGQDGLARIGVAVVALLAEGIFRACDLAPKSKKERKRLLGFPIRWSLRTKTSRI
jgi:hypothetical protein